MMFDTTKEDLVDLLKKIDQLKLQLPDFQRDWVWNDDDIRSLIASIVRQFPVGAILTLTAGGKVKFKPRPLSAAPKRDMKPDEFLLNGQQRLTTLYQSFYSTSPVKTKTIKGQPIKRYYFLDIRRALEPVADYDEMILGAPADRVIRKNFGRDVVHDLSDPNSQFENHLFPLNQIFDEKDWIYGWRDYWKEKGEDIYKLEKDFDRKLVDGIKRYKMPVIKLDKNNSREAICLIFEKVNTGGKKLDAFELLTAIYAADEFNLRDDWLGTPENPGRLNRLKGIDGRQDVFRHLSSTDFLQSCTTLHTYGLQQEAVAQGRDLPGVSCKRGALLSLPLGAYRKHADGVESAFSEVGKFLNSQKIIWHGDVPYPPQSVALATAIAHIGQRAQTAMAQEKYDEWFWSGILGELYGSASESRIARDVPELVAWISEEGPKPQTVQDALFRQERLHTLRTRQSAAYKGIHALLMRQGCRDFITGKAADIMTFFQDSMDIHHIFPRNWCKERGIPAATYNSIINKTALSAGSNRRIGGNAPSFYLHAIEQNHDLSEAQLDDILRSHLIEPEHLRKDDFEAFWQARQVALSGLIGAAMRKPVVTELGYDEPMGEPEDLDDDLLDGNYSTRLDH